jgi:hypothetical protein
MTTFGEFIPKCLKKVASSPEENRRSIKQDEGNPTSVQYLNVLEHRRHGAPEG